MNVSKVSKAIRHSPAIGVIIIGVTIMIMTIYRENNPEFSPLDPMKLITLMMGGVTIFCLGFIMSELISIGIKIEECEE